MHEPARRGPDHGLRWLRLIAGGVAVVLLVSAAVTGALLTWRYRPDGGAEIYLLSPTARWSRRLVHRHEVALAVALPAVALWGALTLQDVWTRAGSRRKAVVSIAALSSFALTIITSFAWRLVKWDQLALWAVTVGDDIHGLWYAGFSERVRFVLVGGVEVSQAAFAPWVILHLAAPVLALAAMAAAWQASRRGAPAAARGQSPEGAPTPSAPSRPPG